MQQFTINHPVIFLPGTLCDERIWFSTWRHMSNNARSFVPLQWADNLEQMLALTNDRVLETGNKVHLVGFSLGGYIASLYAIAHPENVASLTLVGYNSEGLTDSEMKSRQFILRNIQAGKYTGMNKQRLADFIDTAYLNDPHVTETVKAMSDDLGAAVLRNQVQSTTPRQALTDKLANARFPVALIAAENDRIAPLSAMQSMHSRIPRSTLSIVRGSAHMMLLEQPEKLATMISADLEKVERDDG